ncbi:MAG: hypothetical protein ABI602_00955 [Candidatus Saccharibacteria bacterium]
MSDQNNLTTTSGGGAQTTTENPQVATPGSQTQSSQAVQPGTAASLLTSSSGIQLTNASVPLVSLTTSTAPAPSVVPPAATRHALNPVLSGLSVLLFIVAIALFVLTSKTSKKTTI